MNVRPQSVFNEFTLGPLNGCGLYHPANTRYTLEVDIINMLRVRRVPGAQDLN